MKGLRNEIKRKVKGKIWKNENEKKLNRHKERYKRHYENERIKEN